MLWVKAFHIIFMVSWFAGLFYLPRLFVYHASSEDEISRQRFIVMEGKLYWGIMTPAAVLTVGFGIWLIMLLGGASLGWFWLRAKLALVALLLLYHLFCGKLLTDFKHGRNRHSHVWYRWFNEIPVFLLTGIVLLVELQPM